MKRIFRHLLFIIPVVLILSFAVISLISFFFSESINNRFFTEISSFDKLDQYATESTINDNQLTEFIPESSYVKEIYYNGETYLVYAYVFDDVKASISYFNKCTGKVGDSEYNFSMTTNYLFHSKYIAYSGCCLYRIEGGGYRNFAKVVNYINEAFPVEPKVDLGKETNEETLGLPNSP